ncbi:protein kinase superfamily protein [Striga asiatica]|uniref:Protein kinase superfamily protein n=1 Tax=Striga asiatica TaxID=4170 RepID=A0A5A7PF53_STRAF|nr:protein kinase superfamily protein [Striga asiatica]
MWRPRGNEWWTQSGHTQGALLSIVSIVYSGGEFDVTIFEIRPFGNMAVQYEDYFFDDQRCPPLLMSKGLPLFNVEEINYTKEAANVEHFANNFNNIDYVQVPTIYWESTTPHVLVIEYVPNIKLIGWRLWISWALTGRG